MFAEHDRSTPPGESLELYREALDRGGNPHYALRVIEGTGHSLEPSSDGFVEAEAGDLFHNLAPEYVETVTEWVHGLADGPPTSSADPAPQQLNDSTPLAPVAAHESLGVQLTAFGLLAAAFGAYPITAASARLRGRCGPIPGRWPARMLAASGLAVPPLAIGYLGHIMISAGTQPGPVLAGRPLAWLALQLAALGAVAAAAALIVRWRRERGALGTADKLRFGALLAGTAIFLPWAAYWGLFTV